MILTVEPPQVGARCCSEPVAHCHSAAVMTVTDSSGGEHHVHD